ncbi:MAG: LPS assembly protein LptD, partial [Planctomycetota bacterium]
MANSILVLVSLVICNGMAAEAPSRDLSLLAGQDLYITAPVMTLCQETGQQWSHVMVLEDSSMLQIGDNHLSSRNAVVFLRAQRTAPKEGEAMAYLARAYLEGQVSIKRGKKSRTTAVQHMTVEGAQTMVTQFVVTGEVFATVDSQTTIDLKTLETNALYRRAINATHDLTLGPAVPESALVPKADSVIAAQEGRLLQSKKIKRKAAPTRKVDEDKPGIGDFPVQLSAVWEPAPQIHKTSMPDGSDVITASGRFYLWQRRAEDQVIEFMADNLVLFFQPEEFSIDQENQKGNQIGFGKIQAAYLHGNIVMTEGELTTRCEEIYYDFTQHRALVVNASVRMFDEKRGMPIYLRAKRLGRVSEDIFEAREVQLTTSEFYFPQTSLNASKMVLLTGEALKAHQDRIDEEETDNAGKYDARMYDIDARYGDFTFFRWPKVRSNFKRPDVPLSKIKVGNDNDFGTSIETQWHLARLLGLKEPEWLESRLSLDYFSKRGFGTGVEAEWDRKDESYGSLNGYVMRDRGEDDLGRTDNRRNLDPDKDYRGRFSWRNRQYLPDDWQLTTEVGYVSDRYFLESMYRSEFNTDKGQETLVYLKKLRDNWAFSILNKVRINDFETMTEELPTVEFHLKGQSFWDDRLTFYSDTQMSRLRERVDEDNDTLSGSGFYSYAMTRNEVDLPLQWETVKIVPFAAG